MTPYKDLRIQIEKGVKPADMSQDIFEYAKRTAQLDGIFNELTYDFCANQCSHGNLHCCFLDFHCQDAPNEMLKFQEIEALQNGWAQHSKSHCKYLSLEGCKLALFKSPICITSFCSKSSRQIKEKYGEAGRIFMENMKKAEYHGLGLLYEEEREKMFTFMDLAIRQGRRLVELKRRKSEIS